MTPKQIIFVTVDDGVAEVDTRTVPEGVEVRVLDFDSLKEDPKGFNGELDEIDRKYLDDRHPRQLTKLTDVLVAAEAEGEVCIECGQPINDCICDEENNFLGEDDDEEEEGEQGA